MPLCPSLAGSIRGWPSASCGTARLSRGCSRLLLAYRSQTLRNRPCVTAVPPTRCAFRFDVKRSWRIALLLERVSIRDAKHHVAEDGREPHINTAPASGAVFRAVLDTPKTVEMPVVIEKPCAEIAIICTQKQGAFPWRTTKTSASANCRTSSNAVTIRDKEFRSARAADQIDRPSRLQLAEHHLRPFHWR